MLSNGQNSVLFEVQYSEGQKSWCDHGKTTSNSMRLAVTRRSFSASRFSAISRLNVHTDVCTIKTSDGIDMVYEEKAAKMHKYGACVYCV